MKRERFGKKYKRYENENETNREIWFMFYEGNVNVKITNTK